MTDPMYLRSRRPENAVSILTSAIAANINIQLRLLHSIQGQPSSYRNVRSVHASHPLFLAANIRTNSYPPACWTERSESTFPQSAATPAHYLSSWSWPFSTPWTKTDSHGIFFSPLPSSPRRNAFGREQSRMETEYCENQEKKDSTLKAKVGLPTGILDVILDPEESTITATEKKVWFDDQRLVFKTSSACTSSVVEPDPDRNLATQEPGWKLLELRKAAPAAAETAATAGAKRSERTSPTTSLTLTQSSMDVIDGSADDPLSLHSCMLINWFQDRIPHLPFYTILSSSKPICVSDDEPSVVASHCHQESRDERLTQSLSMQSTASDPSLIAWHRSDFYCRPRPLSNHPPPIGTPTLCRSSSTGDVKNAVSLDFEFQSWNEENSDNESDDDSDDEEDGDTITDDDLEERGLHNQSARSSRSNSTDSQDPMRRVRTKIYNAEQTSRLELVVIEQLLQRLSTQIRHEKSELTSFFWAWP